MSQWLVSSFLGSFWILSTPSQLFLYCLGAVISLLNSPPTSLSSYLGFRYTEARRCGSQGLAANPPARTATLPCGCQFIPFQRGTYLSELSKPCCTAVNPILLPPTGRHVLGLKLNYHTIYSKTNFYLQIFYVGRHSS